MVIVKKLIRYSMPAGLLIFAVYRIADHFMVVSDRIAYPAFITSTLFMMIGIAYHGWCFGKRKNPYGKAD